MALLLAVLLMPQLNIHSDEAPNVVGIVLVLLALAPGVALSFVSTDIWGGWLPILLAVGANLVIFSFLYASLLHSRTRRRAARLVAAKPAA